MKKIIQNSPFVVLVMLGSLTMGITMVGSALQQTARTAQKGAAAARRRAPFRPFSTEKQVPVMRTPFQVPPRRSLDDLRSGPQKPSIIPKEGETVADFLKRYAAAEQELLMQQSAEARAERTYLKDAYDAVNYGDLGLAEAVVTDAVKQAVLEKILAKEALHNPNLAALVESAQHDVIFANVGKEVVLSHFERAAQKGDQAAQAFLNKIAEITKTIETEKIEEPISTLWEDLRAQWIKSILTGDSSMQRETDDIKLFKKLLQEEIAEALKDTYVAQAIELNAKKQAEFAKTIIQEAEKHPSNQNLKKLALAARNNAFAAEFKFIMLHDQLKALIAKGNQKAASIFGSLTVGKKELLAKQAAEKQAATAEKDAREAAQEKAAREAKAKAAKEVQEKAEQARLAAIAAQQQAMATPQQAAAQEPVAPAAKAGWLDTVKKWWWGQQYDLEAQKRLRL